jgi:Leucine Rich repeats (2 copies)
LSHLEYLYLGDTQIHDVDLLSLDQLHNLRQLDVSGTGVGKQGIEELKQRLSAVEVKSSENGSD